MQVKTSVIGGKQEKSLSVRIEAILESLLKPQQKPSSIAIAVSGGSDSMALVLLAQEYAIKRSIPVIALTVDHQLRPESSQEALQTTQWLISYGISHVCLNWNHNEYPVRGNLQASARQARYHLLAQYCRQYKIPLLLLGHTEDDQAETIALRQQRSAGPVGLSGMSALSEYNGIALLRPLLTTTRQELQNYLAWRSQPWISDPSNSNPKFDRIKIRKKLEANPCLKRELLSLGAEMAKKRMQIEEEFGAFAKNYVETIADYHLAINQTAWKGLSEPIAIYALSRLLPAISGREYPPRYKELYRLYQGLVTQKGKATLGKCIIHWCKGKIFIYQEGLEMVTYDAHMVKKAEAFAMAKPLVSQPFYCIQET